jgi:hypothetical protein
VVAPECGSRICALAGRCCLQLAAGVASGPERSVRDNCCSERYESMRYCSTA